MLIAVCVTVGAFAGLIGLSAGKALAATPFSALSPTVFIAQGSSTQLDSAIESPTGLVFSPIGNPVGFKYNAIAYDTNNNFLYGVVIAGRPGVGDIIQIDANGLTTDTGVNVAAGSQLEDVGAWDPSNNLIYFGSSVAGAKSMFVYNPATNTGSPLALTAAPRAADLSYVPGPSGSQGYLWGIGNSQIVRVDPLTGTVTFFPIPPGLIPGAPNFVFGAAWTYGNGDLGFSNDTSGAIYEIAVTNEGSTTPTFTLVNKQAGPANNYNDGASIPGQPVDLALTKTASPTTVGNGGQITYTLTVTNNGPGNSSGYVVSDPLPSTLTNESTSTPGCTISAGTLTCQGTALDVGDSSTITVTADAPNPNTTAIVNTATVTGNEADPIPANNTASATVEPQAGADLAIVKTASPTSVTAGGQVTYTMVVTNNGPSDADNVVVNDPLPAGETLVSETPSQGSCAGSSCSLGTILDGGQAQILLTVNVGTTVSGAVTNTATVQSDTPDPNMTNNTSSATIQVTGLTTPTPRVTAPSADLSIVKKVNHAQATPGQMLTYTMVVTNHGPDAADNVTVTDSPKLALSDVHAKSSQGSCTVARTLHCSLGTIADGATVTITVTGKVMTAGHEVNTGTVSSSTTDPKPSNNISRASTNVAAPAPTLGLTKTASPTTIGAGGTVTYKIKVSAANATARDLKVCDALPLGLTFLSASPATSLSNGRECWTIHSLAAGKSRTLLIHAKALMSTHGMLVNHATATATGTKTAHASAKVRVIASPTPKPPTGVTG